MENYLDCDKLTNLFSEWRKYLRKAQEAKKELLKSGDEKHQKNLRKNFNKSTEMRQTYKKYAHEKVTVSDKEVVRVEAAIVEEMKSRIVEDYAFVFETNQDNRVKQVNMKPNRVALTAFSEALPLTQYLQKLKRINCPQSNIKEIPKGLGVPELDCSGSSFLENVSKEVMEEFEYLDIYNTPAAKKKSVQKRMDEVEENNPGVTMKYTMF